MTGLVAAVTRLAMAVELLVRRRSDIPSVCANVVEAVERITWLRQHELASMRRDDALFEQREFWVGGGCYRVSCDVRRLS